MQRPIEAVLNLRKKHNLRAEDVEQLTMETFRPGYRGSAPPSGLAGKFSFEYCAAAPLLDGSVGIDTFTDEKFNSPAMQEVISRVQVQSNGHDDPATATAHLKDGRIVSETCHAFRGAMTNPMSRTERVEKFRECASRVLPKDAVNELQGLMEDLESVPNATVLTALMG